MKKLGLFVIPIMALSLLVNCNKSGGDTPIVENTYTVVLNAGKEASFDLGQQYIFLNDIRENTLLNECEGYSLPISNNNLDFYHWTDEHGNVIDDNTPVTSNIVLTANFYHGPECERDNLKTYIKDDLWEIFNVSDWRGPFSEDLEKKEILQTFQNNFLSAIDNPKLNDVITLEAMKEMYHVLKDQLFKVRYKDTTTINEMLNECLYELDKTSDDVTTHNLALGKAIVYLNISYFKVKNYSADPISGICEYAYQVLLNKLYTLSLDNPNLINAWTYMVRGLMIASYHLSQLEDFDSVLESAEQEINTLLASEEYTKEDIKILAKLYADYHIASIRYTTDYSGDLEYIINNYNTKEPETRFLVELYRNYFSSYASENGVTSSTDIDSIKNKFKTEIEAIDDVEKQVHYCTIATSFAEAIRINPSEASYVSGIVNSFFSAINDVEMIPDIENYIFYIEPFAAFADATSKIDFNHEIDTSYTPSISFAQYNTNASWMIEQIKKCEYKDNEIAYEGMNILSRYVAMYSGYGNIATATFSNNEFVNFPAQIILNPKLFVASDDRVPYVFTAFLPMYNYLILKSLRNCPLYYLSQVQITDYINAIFLKHSDSMSQTFRKTYEKIFLKLCCHCAVYDELVSIIFANFDYLNRFVYDIPNFYEKYLSLYYAPYVNLANYPYATYSIINVDRSRTLMIYDYISQQTFKVFDNDNQEDEFNIAKYNHCIVRVLAKDYLPNITENMTEGERNELIEKNVTKKIDDLLANYK